MDELVSIFENKFSIEKPDYKKLYDQKCIELEYQKKISQYTLAKIGILENNKYNIGERDELLLVLYLYHLNNIGEFGKLVTIFGDDASNGIEIINVNTQKTIEDISMINKAQGLYKADIIIKMIKTGLVYNISIKSKNGANPTLINHTPRSSKVFIIDGILNSKVKSLDMLINEYILKRNDGIIGEDIGLTLLDSITNSEIRQDVLDVLVYFMFDGTGKGDSKIKANAILIYDNGNIRFIKCDTNTEKKEYLETILENCVISLRDKGMPKIINDYCKPWIYEQHGKDGTIKYKGSLHIRI
jgi:predicted nucleic acid-binding Zn ribbon protein